jgi:hypothetical protein
VLFPQAIVEAAKAKIGGRFKQCLEIIFGVEQKAYSEMKALEGDFRKMATIDSAPLTDDERDQLYQKHLGIRASTRVSAREARRQGNLEAIAAEAAKQLPSSFSDDPPEEDWVQQYADSCQDISDQEMQVIWGKLLATEMSAPGTFSRRTLDHLKLFSRYDAELLCSLGAYATHVDHSWILLCHGSRFRTMGTTNVSLAAEMGIDIDAWHRAVDLGIIHPSDSTSVIFNSDAAIANVIPVGSGSVRHIEVTPPIKGPDGSWHLPSLQFTRLGHELLNLVDVPANDEFIEELCVRLVDEGYVVASPIVRHGR